MKISKRTLVVTLTILLIFLCGVAVNLLTGGRLAVILFSFADISPPHAVYSFLTRGDTLTDGHATVIPGEQFIPLLTIVDDWDPSPEVKAWVAVVSESAFEHVCNEDEGEPIIIGQPISFRKTGMYNFFVRVTDTAGNSMIYSNIVNVVDAGDLRYMDSDEVTKPPTQIRLPQNPAPTDVNAPG